MQSNCIFMIVYKGTHMLIIGFFKLIIVSYTATSKGRIRPFGVNDHHQMVLKCQNSHIMVQIFLVVGLDSRK